MGAQPTWAYPVLWIAPTGQCIIMYSSTLSSAICYWTLINSSELHLSGKVTIRCRSTSSAHADPEKSTKILHGFFVLEECALDVFCVCVLQPNNNNNQKPKS